jgi:hypothetical protein
MKFAVLFEESDVSYFKLQVPIMALRPALYLIHTNHRAWRTLSSWLTKKAHFKFPHGLSNPTSPSDEIRV